MGILLHILYNELLKYVFTPMLVIYLIGRPRYFVELLNKFLLITIPLYKIRIFFFLAFFFVANIIQTLYKKYNYKIIILEVNSKTTNDAFDHLKENYIRTKFLFERNIFMYFFFFISIMIFLKFSKVYERTYDLENKLNELKKKNQQNQQIQKEK